MRVLRESLMILICYLLILNTTVLGQLKHFIATRGALKPQWITSLLQKTNVTYSSQLYSGPDATSKFISHFRIFQFSIFRSLIFRSLIFRSLIFRSLIFVLKLIIKRLRAENYIDKGRGIRIIIDFCL